MATSQYARRAHTRGRTPAARISQTSRTHAACAPHARRDNVARTLRARPHTNAPADDAQVHVCRHGRRAQGGARQPRCRGAHGAPIAQGRTAFRRVLARRRRDRGTCRRAHAPTSTRRASRDAHPAAALLQPRITSATWQPPQHASASLRCERVGVALRVVRARCCGVARGATASVWRCAWCDRVVVALRVVPQGVSEQEGRLARFIVESGRACVVVVNKWDLVPNKDDALYRSSAKCARTAAVCCMRRDGHRCRVLHGRVRAPPPCP
jgi:hypothetical protein